jgi:hypothetical protein
MEISCISFAVEYCRRFGQAAVERGFITPEQLKEALTEQVNDDLAKMPHRLLGDILFEKNFMTADQIEAVLEDTLGFASKGWKAGADGSNPDLSGFPKGGRAEP